MSQYVEKELLLEDFRTFMAENYDKEKCVSAESCKACEAKCLWYRIITKALVADVAPVRHARWVPVSNTGIGATGRCTACNKAIYGFVAYNYCPNCGAKMDLEVSQ